MYFESDSLVTKQIKEYQGWAWKHRKHRSDFKIHNAGVIMKQKFKRVKFSNHCRPPSGYWNTHLNRINWRKKTPIWLRRKIWHISSSYYKVYIWRIKHTEKERIIMVDRCTLLKKLRIRSNQNLHQVVHHCMPSHCGGLEHRLSMPGCLDCLRNRHWKRLCNK